MLTRLSLGVSCWHWILTCYASVNHAEDSKSWETMNAIKQDILRRMDSFPCPVKICCVKFIQRVVLVQTPGLISDPRVCSTSSSPFATQMLTSSQRPEQNETSLAIVPRTHTLLAIPNLEAEASGLLDRLLGVFQEEIRYRNSNKCKQQSD